MTTGPTGAATPELSVIVPAYGRLDALRGLLASLRHQRLAASRYEVLLVDDGNPRPLADALAGTLPDRVRVLRQDPNAGPAAAKNLGLRGARGRICLFLNADAVLEPATLAAHLALHPEGGPVRAVLGRFDSIPACRSTLLELTHRARLWFPYEEMTPGAAHSCRYFWTCNLSLPTDVVRRAGGFDPRFRAPAWEDVELGYRLEQRGIQVEYHPHLGCGHDHAVDLAATVRRSRLIGHDWVRVARKHGPAAPSTTSSASTRRPSTNASRRPPSRSPRPSVGCTSMRCCAAPWRRCSASRSTRSPAAPQGTSASR